MRSLIMKQAERFLRERKKYKCWIAVFFCLAVLVSLGTVMILRYTGRAMTGEPRCYSKEEEIAEKEAAQEEIAEKEAAEEGIAEEEAAQEEIGQGETAEGETKAAFP